MRTLFVKCMLAAVAWAITSGHLSAREAESAAVPEPYVETTGTVRGFELLAAEDEGAGGIDFGFHFKPDGSDREWLVISRGSTPFEVLRLGPTYVQVDKQTFVDGARVWLLGVKFVDRIPATFHKKTLPSEGTITALMISSAPQKAGAVGTPLYVNNWFHPWRKDKAGVFIEGIVDRPVTSHYVDRQGPHWVCGWLPANTSSPDPANRLAEVRHLLDEADVRTIAAEPFKKGVYRGYLVSDKARPQGYRLKLTQFWRHVPETGGYELIIGNDKGLERLP
ncbi:MAG: hypothetical protein ACI9HK_005414 [Pirellulaceae bacterium]|jgi:hypothetical protein